MFCFWLGECFQMLSADMLTYWRVLPVYFLVLAWAVASYLYLLLVASSPLAVVAGCTAAFMIGAIFAYDPSRGMSRRGPAGGET